MAADVDVEELEQLAGEEIPEPAARRGRGRPVSLRPRGSLRQPLRPPATSSTPAWWTVPRTRDEFSKAARKRAEELVTDRRADLVKTKVNF